MSTVSSGATRIARSQGPSERKGGATTVSHSLHTSPVPLVSPRPAAADARERAVLAAKIAADNRGRDVLLLDMCHQVDWVDFVVIATGTSRRQLVTMSDRIEEALDEQYGDAKIGQEGYDRGDWVCLDFGDLVVHLFDDELREYYQLEHLWGDAERIDWQAELPPADEDDDDDEAGE